MPENGPFPEDEKRLASLVSTLCPQTWGLKGLTSKTEEEKSFQQLTDFFPELKGLDDESCKAKF